MNDVVLYIGLVIGVGLSTFGYLVSSHPSAFFKEEGKQVMWVALGGYMMLFGALFTIFSAYFLWN